MKEKSIISVPRSAASNPVSITKEKLNWPLIIKQWNESNLSQSAFCKLHNVDYNQFLYNRSKITHNDGTKPRLLPVEILPNTTQSPLNNQFILHYPNGLKLSIPSSVDPVALKSLLSCLEGN